MQLVDSAFHGSLGLVEAAARTSARPVGFRNTGVSWGTHFDVIYDEKGRVISVKWGDFDPRLAQINYGDVTPIYGDSWNLNLLLTPQNSVVTIPLTSKELKGLIQDRLSYGDCADYVKRLMSQAAKMAAANNPPNEFKDIPDLFDQIVAQPKGGFKFEAATGTAIGTGSGSAGGYLVRGDATITVTPVRYYANSPSYVIHSAIENAPYRYGITGLHEVIHHAGRYRYDDDFLTKVARSLEPDANISYWDHALQNHCLPANRRYNYDYTK
jgi:hypothetical protein